MNYFGAALAAFVIYALVTGQLVQLLAFAKPGGAQYKGVQPNQLAPLFGI